MRETKKLPFREPKGESTMNLTACSSACAWQKDGRCTLPPTAPMGTRRDGCLYFREAEKCTMQNA
ncbi:MAG: hypothetical protein IKM31_10720 [Oscillospiraceae bacterium]|nr:hypothetical protein [Oscillospiraceae bacterium]